MNTKRVFALILTFVMALSLTACAGSSSGGSGNSTGGNTGSNAGSSSGGDKKQTIALTMGASTPGSAGQVYVSGIASLVGLYGSGITFTPETTGGGGADAEMAAVLNQELDFCFTSNKVGMETYATNPNLRSVWGMYFQEFFCVTNDKNITDITQFEGKTISYGPVGSTPEFSTVEILDLFGVNATLVNMGWTDSFTSLKEGKIDAVMGCAGNPASALLEAETAFDSHWVKFTDEQIEKICSTYSHYAPVEMAINTYSDMEAEYGADGVWKTVGIWMGVYCTEETDEDAIYELLTCIMDHTDELVASTVESARNTTVDSFTHCNVPLHKGALRFYQDRGIEVPPEYIL